MPEQMSDARTKDDSDSPDTLIGTNLAAKKAETIKIARLARGSLQLAAGALALTFTWIKFRGLNFGPLINDLSAQLLSRTTLAVYYLSWVSGVSADVDDQEVIYVEPPDRGRVIVLCVAATILIGIPFGFLCYLSSYQVVLSAFIVFNFVCWWLMTRWVLPDTVNKTVAYYTQHNAYLQLLEVELFVGEYLKGPWQIWRYCAGGVIVVIIDLVKYSRLYDRLSGIATFPTKDFALAVLLLIFVIVMEGWAWLCRMKFKAGRSLIERITSIYDFRLKRGHRSWS
jgi:hypothetical protein